MANSFGRIAALSGIALAAVLALPAGAQMRAQGTAALPVPGVIRIPASASVPMLPVSANEPIRNGEYSTPIRVPADRVALAVQIRAQRADEAARFAAGAGPGVTVALRRSRY
jgi:hypothetical protein